MTTFKKFRLILIGLGLTAIFVAWAIHFFSDDAELQPELTQILADRPEPSEACLSRWALLLGYGTKEPQKLGLEFLEQARQLPAAEAHQLDRLQEKMGLRPRLINPNNPPNTLMAQELETFLGAFDSTEFCDVPLADGRVLVLDADLKIVTVAALETLLQKKPADWGLVEKLLQGQRAILQKGTTAQNSIAVITSLTEALIFLQTKFEASPAELARVQKLKESLQSGLQLGPLMEAAAKRELQRQAGEVLVPGPDEGWLWNWIFPRKGRMNRTAELLKEEAQNCLEADCTLVQMRRSRRHLGDSLARRLSLRSMPVDFLPLKEALDRLQLL